MVLLVLAAAFVVWRASKGESPSDTLKVLREVAPGAAAPEPDPIETVDVGTSIDSQIDLGSDAKAAQRREGFVGVLPGDFPRDVYVYEPSILFDYGNDPGNRFIRLRIRRPASEVAETYARRLRSDGWSGPDLGSDLVTYAKAGRSIRVQVVSEEGGTLLRIGY